jgi:RNA polymerase sigma factor (sigma-70 family)
MTPETARAGKVHYSRRYKGLQKSHRVSRMGRAKTDPNIETHTLEQRKRNAPELDDAQRFIFYSCGGYISMIPMSHRDDFVADLECIFYELLPRWNAQRAAWTTYLGMALPSRAKDLFNRYMNRIKHELHGFGQGGSPGSRGTGDFKGDLILQGKPDKSAHKRQEDRARREIVAQMLRMLRNGHFKGHQHDGRYYAAIFRASYLKRKTYEEIGETLNLSRQRIEQILHRLRDELALRVRSGRLGESFDFEPEFTP